MNYRTRKAKQRGVRARELEKLDATAQVIERKKLRREASMT